MKKCGIMPQPQRGIALETPLCQVDADYVNLSAEVLSPYVVVRQHQRDASGEGAPSELIGGNNLCGSDVGGGCPHRLTRCVSMRSLGGFAREARPTLSGFLRNSETAHL